MKNISTSLGEMVLEAMRSWIEVAMEDGLAGAGDRNTEKDEKT